MKRLDLFEAILIASGFLIPLIYFEQRIGLLTFSIADTVVIFLAAAFFRRVYKEAKSLALTVIDVTFLAFLIWAGISLIRAQDFAKSLREFVWLFESGLVFFMVVHAGLEVKEVFRILRAWSYGALVVSTLGLLHYFTSILSGDGPVIIWTTFPEANSLAAYLITVIPLTIAFAFNSKLDQKIFWAIISTASAIALIPTNTRGAWYALIISLLIMALLLKDRRIVFLLVVYTVIFYWSFPQVEYRGVSGLKAVTGIISSVIPNPIRQTHNRIVSDSNAVTKDVPKSVNDADGTDRVQLWQVGLKMWQDHPLVGVGIGNYIYLYNDYVNQYRLDAGLSALEPHNSFIKILAEMGIVGLGLFLAVVLMVARLIICNLRSIHDKFKLILLIGMITSLLAFVLQNNTNSLFFVPRASFLVWLMAGMALTFVPLGTEQKRSQVLLN